MSVIVRTAGGVVTSFREAWTDDSGRSVWTWRTDGAEPHDFGTVEAAKTWIDEVWVGSLDAKEKLERTAWLVEDIEHEEDA